MDRKDIITDMDDPRRCDPGEVERLKDRVKELEDKYENNPQTCNSGHKTHPMKLWDCPECTEIIRTRVRELEVENKRLIDKYESGPDPVYTMSRIDSQFGDK